MANEASSAPANEEDDELLYPEKWWRDHYDLLEAHGYRLRPRYHPLWVPSWKNSGKRKFLYEDSIYNKVDYVIDATRISDGRVVTVKRVSSESQELSIALFLATETEIPASYMNHSVPVLDHFDDESLPQFSFLVMPLLRRFNDPQFFSVDEVVDFIQQTLEGLCYIHSRGVAHRDCAKLNIMLDASTLYPRGFHFAARAMDPSGLKAAQRRRRRDVQGVKYYFIDFGISSRFEECAKAESRLVTGAVCQDHDVPELSSYIPYDPFAVDVFLLGNVYRKSLLNDYVNLSFLSSLVESMTSANPKNRPSSEEALAQFRALVDSQYGCKLRWRLKEKRSGKIVRLLQDIGSVSREGTHISKEIIKISLRYIQKHLS